MNLLRKCSNWKFIPNFLLHYFENVLIPLNVTFLIINGSPSSPLFFFFFSDWFISRRLYLKLFVARDTEVI